MRRLKAFICLLIVFIMLTGSVSFSAKAAEVNYSSMNRREFVLHLVSLGGKSYNYPWSDGEFVAVYQKYMIKGSFGEEYPWASTSFEEFDLLSKGDYIDMMQPAFNPDGSKSEYHERRLKYNKETGFDKVWESYKEQARLNGLAIKNKKMWDNSKLEGNPNSHGVLTQIDNSIYEREGEDGKPITGTEIGIGSFNMDEPSGVTKVIMEFLCWLIFFLADGIDSILSTGGIALDNVIFGRVAGYGVITETGGTPITLFGFELTNGNPYGYIGAMIFQRIRTYIYLFMAVYCLFKMVKIAASTDYMKMKMDFTTFIQNALLSFSFIVLMPYIFDIYLYIRDVLLKAVAFDSLQDLFGTTGFLASFRAAAESASLNIIPNLIYLGAVILSLVVAGIYIAYAMSMMVHFILFPFVCLRGIGDRNAYKEWATEALGLTIMPLIDGILLIIPLTFSDMANGNLAFNLLSLVSCGMLLTARKQARRSLGIKDTGLDMGAMATVVGLGAMMKGIGKTVGKMGKKIGEAREHSKASKEDENMAEFYESEAKAGRVNAPQAASGKKTLEPGLTPGGFGADNLRQHVNVDNFESGPFKGNLDNETMAKLYRQRATKHSRAAFTKMVGAAGAGLGGMRGFAVGMGAGAFMGVGAQSTLAGAGMDAGSSIGGFVQEAGVSGIFALGKYVDTDTSNEISNVSYKGAGEGSTSESLGQIDGGEIIVPTSNGASADSSGVVELDMINADGRRAREAEFEKLRGDDYRKCAAEAAQKMDVATLKGNQEFGDMVAKVRLRFDEIKANAQSGNFSPEVVFGDFNGLHKDFNGKKEDFFHEATVEVGNSTLDKESFNMDCQTDRDLIGRKVRELTRNGGQLTQNGGYMTNSFDKNFDITWYKWEQELRREFEKQGYQYSGGKK